MGILSRLMSRFGNRVAGTSTDVLEILALQHTQVDELFARMKEPGIDRRATFTELADLIAAHAKVEEKLFYPAIMAKETRDMLRESVEEHLGIKRLLADLVSMRLDDESFDAKLAVLQEQVAHHAHEEEEGKLFDRVRDLLNADERAALGNEVIVLFEEIVALHPYKTLPREVDAAADLPRITRH